MCYYVHNPTYCSRIGVVRFPVVATVRQSLLAKIHSYVLERIQKEMEGYLPDWAFGFIAGRSCRDALLVANLTNRK